MRPLPLIMVFLCLVGMVQAQVIRPEQAVQSVRSFIGDPEAEITVQGLRSDGPTGRNGLYYDVTTRGNAPAGGYYEVRARDGAVTFMSLDQPNSGREQPALNLQQAQAIAEGFARRHHPPFTRGQWRLDTEYLLNGARYQFFWYPMLSNAGTLGPWYLSVSVDGIAGRVVTYAAPPDRPIMAPTVPQVSLEQARQIAARFARYDPARVPFSKVWLRVQEDRLGIQRLIWHLRQEPVPPPTGWYAPGTGKPAGIILDAITRAVIGFEVAFSGYAEKPFRPQVVPPRPDLVRLRQDTYQGRVVGASVTPRIEDGTLWVRAELLRGFGAQVQVAPGEIEIRSRDKVLAGPDVGAKWRDHGWWVPLRRTAGALGWRVDWLRVAREAVVRSQTDAPQKQANS